MTYVLIGNYGTGNLGDELLKEYFLTQFPHVDWKVISARPGEGEYYRLPCGIRSLFTPWWKTLHALWKSDGVVFGGGTLFTDIESILACRLWGLHAKVAKMMGKKVLLAFQGVGPFLHPKAERMAQNIFQKADYISIRDAASLQRVKLWNLNKNIVHTYDPILHLFISLKEEKKYENSTKNVLTVIPRKNSTETFRSQCKHVVETQGPWDVIRIVSLQENEDDIDVLTDGIGDHPYDLVSVHSADELCSWVADSSFVLTQRFHAALAALALGVPFEAVAQHEGDKLDAISTQSLDELLCAIQIGHDSLLQELE